MKIQLRETKLRSYVYVLYLERLLSLKPWHVWWMRPELLLSILWWPKMLLSFKLPWCCIESWTILWLEILLLKLLLLKLLLHCWCFWHNRYLRLKLLMDSHLPGHVLHFFTNDVPNCLTNLIPYHLSHVLDCVLVQSNH